MDVDTENNIYVIIRFQERESDDQSWSFELFVFDETGEKKLESPLPFHQSIAWPKVRMAINKSMEIAILDCHEKVLYVGSECVEENSFKVDKTLCLNELDIGWCLSYIKVMLADFNGTKVIAADNKSLHIYRGNGQLERHIKIAKEHGYIDSVTINHVTKYILVKTHQPPGNRSLLIFSETGELLDSLYLGSSRWICFAELTSHPNGPVALVGKRGALFLQL
jgi:hypothetical protein